MSDSSETPLDDATDDAPASNGFSLLLLAIPVAVVLTLVVMAFFGQAQKPAGGSAWPTVGEPLPALVAEGWLNGEPPTAEDLAGHVMVLDVWASWCGPCRGTAPKLVSLHKKYKDQGVLFVGLSVESAGEIPEMKKFLDHFQITWPNGYGANLTLDQLAVEGIPRVWVVGKDGKIAWEDELPGTIEKAIEKALAAGGE